MAVTVFPITDDFAAEIGDVDLSRPLSPTDWQAVEAAFETYSVLVFPNQSLNQDQHLDFARRFGPLETSVYAISQSFDKLRLKPEIADVSNIDDKNEILARDSRKRAIEVGNRLWHTDSSFKRLPAKASLLYCREMPPVGGHTEFADMRAAYDALPAETKTRLTGLVAEHALMYSRARLGFTAFTDEERRQLPPVPQVMVRRHAGSGRMTLYLASHAGRVLGMPEAEGKALIDQLLAHASQRQFVYTHRWRVGDLVMWDDRCTMHRGRPYEDLRWRRDMQRATVSDVAPTCEQEGVRIAAE
ncbi:MAG: TauD/TfdA family dioxygenase [Alphaproteobacteria bacterium]|nr:TauD/TfdA family dioxygenase [Alphaproteobacteria bacterium]